MTEDVQVLASHSVYSVRSLWERNVDLGLIGVAEVGLGTGDEVKYGGCCDTPPIVGHGPD